MTFGQEKTQFVLGLANETLFAPTRTKTMKALQAVGQCMTPELIERFPKSVALFAPAKEDDCSLVVCPDRPHTLLFLSADLEEQSDEEITDRLIAEFARLLVVGVPKDNSPYTLEQELQFTALCQELTPERAATA